MVWIWPTVSPAFFALFKRFYKSLCLFTFLTMSNWPLKLSNFAKTCTMTLTRDEEKKGPQHDEVHIVTYYRESTQVLVHLCQSTLVVNGVQYGKASAKTLSDARMAAAQQAYEALDSEMNGS
ncbi:hypothetical protein DL96DRAFT_477127 [Flagelloscypha sp. PMI_526]|nr:hypothetical protein DL96DRAFT_477127 [Flagelloscypha sp. PMI_526]